MILKQTLLSIIILYFSCFAQDSLNNKFESRLIGKPACNFKVTTLSGKQVSLSDYKGKVLIVNIWDTVCPPCIAEFPHYIEFYKTYKSSGLEILGLTKSLYTSKEELQKFIKKHKLNFSNAIIKDDTILKLGGTKGIPTTYIIDKTGKIFKQHFGYFEKESLEKVIKELIKT